MPQVATVMPYMKGIYDRLTNSAITQSYHRAIRAGLILGRKTLERYWLKFDESDSYRLAVCESSSLLGHVPVFT